MSYYFSKDVPLSFDETLAKFKKEIDRIGLIILSEIDFKEMLSNKLEIKIAPYRIIGICSSIAAYRAIQRDKYIGTLLPCNVVVQQKTGSMTTVTIEDPVVKIAKVVNHKLAGISGKTRVKLQKLLERL